MQDTQAGLSQILAMTTNGAPTNALYGHQRLATVTGGAYTWLLHDRLGSTRMELDSAGVPLAVPTYDPWGQRSSNGSTPFGFTGELQNPTTGLIHLRARWYHPGTGTLLGRDPFSGYQDTPYSLHPYQYAYSQPTLYTDPSGLCIGLECFLPPNLCKNLDASHPLCNPSGLDSYKYAREKAASEIIKCYKDLSFEAKVTYTRISAKDPDAAFRMKGGIELLKGSFVPSIQRGTSWVFLGDLTGGINNTPLEGALSVGTEYHQVDTVTLTGAQANLGMSFPSILELAYTHLGLVGSHANEVIFHFFEYDVKILGALQSNSYKNVEFIEEFCTPVACSFYPPTSKIIGTRPNGIMHGKGRFPFEASEEVSPGVVNNIIRAFSDTTTYLGEGHKYQVSFTIKN